MGLCKSLPVVSKPGPQEELETPHWSSFTTNDITIKDYVTGRVRTFIQNILCSYSRYIAELFETGFFR